MYISAPKMAPFGKAFSGHFLQNSRKAGATAACRILQLARPYRKILAGPPHVHPAQKEKHRKAIHASCIATSNKCLTSRNKCLTSSNKKLLVTNRGSKPGDPWLTYLEFQAAWWTSTPGIDPSPFQLIAKGEK